MASRKGRQEGIHVAGIRLRFHFSWFFVFVLTTVALGLGHLRQAVPGHPIWVYLVAGFVVAGIFALALVLHELSHSLVAIRCGVPVPEITLHLLGGLSRIQTEADTPGDDALIAAAGPFCSLLFAAGFWVLTEALPLPKPSIVWYVLAYATYINVGLVLFNLIPGLPLDGGRLLRSVLWWRTGSLTRGTYLAGEVGKGFAYLILLYGVFQFFRSHPIAGGWNVMMGLFMRSAATQTLGFAYLNEALRRGPVKEIMVGDVARIPPDANLDDAVYHYFVRYGFAGFPVGEGTIVGMVSLNQIRAVPRTEHKAVLVKDIMETRIDEHFVAPDEPMRGALLRMQDYRLERLFVGTPQDLQGMVTEWGLRRIAKINQLLATPLGRGETRY